MRWEWNGCSAWRARRVSKTSSSGTSAIVGIQLGVMLTVNQCSCRKVRQSVASGLLICTALAALALPIRVHAQFTGTASATGQFESNSNVYALQYGTVQPGSNDSRRSDTYYSYGAELDGNYSWGRQQFHATANAHQFDYQHFTQLNHNDYSVDAGLNWKLGDRLDGGLDIVRTHTMVPLYDLTGSARVSSSLTNQQETAQIGIKLSSDWRVEGSATTSKGEQPIPGAPGLQLTQTTGTTSIEYVGIGGLTSGLTAAYLSGDYSGSNVTINPSYRQETLGFLANYKLSRTTVEGQLGYSRRNSDTGRDSTSGVTGALDLKHQLTPKTSFTVKIDRAIKSYYLNSGSEIDTDASVGVNWQATYKLAVSLSYMFNYRDFPRQGNDPVNSDRIDRQQFATLGIYYQPRRWLTIRPYANLQTRRSNFIGGDYNATVFGVYVTVSTPNKGVRGR